MTIRFRLADLYRGMELGMCLDIVTELNNGCTLDKAKEIVDRKSTRLNSSHSGESRMPSSA